MNAPKTAVKSAPKTALEMGFPTVEISELAQQESWRKEIYRPAYHIHKWWATRLGSVFRGITLGALTGAGKDIWQGFYERYDFADKVVLDPFMGSGTTLGEALKLGARAVGSDINPVSTFMVRQALTRASKVELCAAFEELEAKAAPTIRQYYMTRDPESGSKIPVLYYFWCKTVTTPDGQQVPLFSRYIFAQHTHPKKNPDAWSVCPACWEIFMCRYDSTCAECPGCGQRFDPQDGPARGQYVRMADGRQHRIKDLVSAKQSPPDHRLFAMLAMRDNGEKVYLPIGQEDEALFDEAVARLESEDLPLPTMSVRPGYNTNQARGYNYLYWRDFFNARQLLCLGVLLRHILEIEDERVREQMLCLFSGTLEFNNMFCSYKGEGTGAVRHMFSHHILKPERTPLENSVWGTSKSSGTFCTLFESRLLRAKQYLNEPFELQLSRDLFGARNGTHKLVASSSLDPTCVESWEEFQRVPKAVMVLNGDSARLPIPDASVDAVVTDPPYFDFVHYSELSDFFFAWLSPVLDVRYGWMGGTDCSDSGEVQDRDPKAFARQLRRVFSECRRVLKTDGVMAFSFHHSRPEGWAAIHDAINGAGLAVVASHIVYGELSASSPKSATREPISVDAIIVCRRREAVSRDGAEMRSVVVAVDEASENLEALGVRMSKGDMFVVAAAQTLIQHSQSGMNFREMVAQLMDVRNELTADIGK